MEYLKTNDNCRIAYTVIGSDHLSPLILLHGFTGSSAVFKRNIPTLSRHYQIIAPDLRGHGESDKTAHGYHVARLAMDLKELLDHLGLTKPGSVRCVAGSLGCAILWSFAELFTPVVFSHMVWVDQAPMQNYASDGSWGVEDGNRSMNSSAALANLQATLKYEPDAVYRGTIGSCLGYLSHPSEDVTVPEDVRASDEDFFLNIARKGEPQWHGKLMADHTSLDWRDTIANAFGTGLGLKTQIFVVASKRSGCFPAKGVLAAVALCNTHRSRSDQDTVAKGVAIEWGGHWCYWEDPDKFNSLVLRELQSISG